MRRDYAIVMLYIFHSHMRRVIQDVTRRIIVRLIEQCVHYARDMHHDAPRMRSWREEREDSCKNTLCNGCYNAHIALLYTHENYVTDDKHTTPYQREKEVKDARKYFRNLVIFDKNSCLHFSN